MRKPLYETKASNYLLRSKHSDTMIMVAAAVRRGRIGFDDSGGAILLNAAGQWVGNAHWTYGQLCRRGFIVSHRVPGTWRDSKPELTVEGLLSLDGALAALRDVTAHTRHGLPITEAYFIARIDNIRSEPRWCTAHGWHPGNTLCAECVKLEELDAEDCATPMLNDFGSEQNNDEPVILPSDEPKWCTAHGWYPGHAPCAECVKLEELDAEDCATPMLNDFGSEQDNDEPVIVAEAQPAPGYSIPEPAGITVPSDMDVAQAIIEHWNCPVCGTVLAVCPIEGIREFNRELYCSIGCALHANAAIAAPQPGSLDDFESESPGLTEYEHILDARRALAPGNSTGLAQSHADEARFWRRLAESADDALLRAAYGLAAAAADVAATGLR
jgi:hypothetical protein